MKDSLTAFPETLHWAHAVGGTLLFVYAAYAIFLGWQIRLGQGGQVFPLSYEQPAAQRHPYMMSLVLLFLFLEIPDGLTLMSVNEQPLLKSTHASTAVVIIALMGVVALIGYGMGSFKTARDAHTYLGMATVVALGAHAYFGVALGWSF